MYYVDILKSLKNGRHYIGCTSNLENRLKEHNNGETRGNRCYRPFEIAYKEEFSSLVEARRRERFIKAQKSRRFIEDLINRGVA